jgi:hypothetical protein
VQETGIQNYQRIGPGTEHRFHVLVMMYVQLFLIGLDLKLLPSPQVTFTYKPINSHPRPHQTPHTTRRARHCTCLAQARRSPTPGGGRNAPAPAPAPSSVRLAHSPPPLRSSDHLLGRAYSVLQDLKACAAFFSFRSLFPFLGNTHPRKSAEIRQIGIWAQIYPDTVSWYLVADWPRDSSANILPNQ